ncbi:helix-turn-helix domain-containing protein [Gilvimarinus sp. 1_MG-2023]|uniref:helix-turn-helix domain-containing protein n=1 Tax=Gilvimarinus sp. 1_MG-2023 TaxID=3062638 RepID=UPI0026E2E021|nr:helix-turn-helix domain-containing protein [Gilvimarinus sp. 1_MG-2023]MDO6748372.1 helix-turn-helix domain-containing protein [Gilvimarinus sp. 1_MG-2023]
MTETADVGAELLKLLYIASTSLGLWTCLSIGLNKRCPANIKRSLLLFIGLLLVVPVNAYLGLIMHQPPPLLHSLASTLTWCYGPLLLMLVNDTVQRTQNSQRLLLQFFPFIALAAIHYIKLEWLHFGLYYSALLLHVVIYLSVIAVRLYRYRKKLAILGSEFRNSTYHWLLYLIAGMFVILIYDNVLLALLHLGVPIRYIFVAVSIGGLSFYISTIALLLLLQPHMFDQPVDSYDSPTDLESTKPAQEALECGRQTELSEAVAGTLQEMLEKVMSEQKLYLDTGINVAKLAATLEISSHQLSELLNIHLHTSFYDYLNRYRLQEALVLMNTGPKTQSITDIAFVSGFNNRNTFYRVFKESTGLTPGEYRKQRLAEGVGPETFTSGE